MDPKGVRPLTPMATIILKKLREKGFNQIGHGIMDGFLDDFMDGVMDESKPIILPTQLLSLPTQLLADKVRALNNMKVETTKWKEIIEELMQIEDKEENDEASGKKTRELPCLVESSKLSSKKYSPKKKSSHHHSNCSQASSNADDSSSYETSHIFN